MFKNAFFVFALVAITTITSQPQADAQGSSTTAIVELAASAPFNATSRHRQRFYSQFKLSAADVNKPLTLVIHNGYDGRPGFNWIRALLGGDMDVSNVKGAEEPSADLLFDENYIERHTLNVDLTGKVFEGVNTVILEATAQKGAVMSWVLQGPMTPEFAPINPSTAQIGGRLTLAGRGFSVDPSENTVSMNGHNVSILYASRTSLTVKVPDHATEGSADVVVTTNNIRSAPYTISITR